MTPEGVKLGRHSLRYRVESNKRREWVELVGISQNTRQEQRLTHSAQVWGQHQKDNQ